MEPQKLKKLVLILIIFGLINGFFDLGYYFNQAKANLFDNFLDFFRKTFNPQDFSTSSQTSTQSQISQNPEISLYKPVEDYEMAVIKAVESAQDSVVSIIISKYLSVIEKCPYNPFFDLPPEFKQFFEEDFFDRFYVPCDKGKKELQKVGGGTGFIISENGLIITNKHVVYDKEAEYTVLTNDGKKYKAKVLALDPYQDIAFIKIEATGLKPVKLGDSDSLKLGQTVIAIGNALGEFRNTVSVGVVSGLLRNITASGPGFGSEFIRGVIQTDAAINPGNSGGPLLNLKGEVIGINTAIASGAENIGFAIPINYAKRAIRSIQESGEIKVPYLGVRYLIITEELAKKEGLSVDYGALIRGNEDGPGVIKNSPAEKAGLQAEDIILEFNGEKITKDNPLFTIIQKYNVGDIVTLKVKRGEKILEFKIKLEERPANI